MFIVLGVVTAITGAATAMVLPDSPMNAGWLEEKEKVALLMHISENRTGVENRHFRILQIKELLLDPQIWLMVFITILVSTLISRFVDY